MNNNVTLYQIRAVTFFLLQLQMFLVLLLCCSSHQFLRDFTAAIAATFAVALYFNKCIPSLTPPPASPHRCHKQLLGRQLAFFFRISIFFPAILFTLKNPLQHLNDLFQFPFGKAKTKTKTQQISKLFFEKDFLPQPNKNCMNYLCGKFH